jgi:hypothetical protein
MVLKGHHFPHPLTQLPQLDDRRGFTARVFRMRR